LNSIENLWTRAEIIDDRHGNNRTSRQRRNDTCTGHPRENDEADPDPGSENLLHFSLLVPWSESYRRGADIAFLYVYIG
jgi:hypothetical protein